jgi:hypothetical protein
MLQRLPLLTVNIVKTFRTIGTPLRKAKQTVKHVVKTILSIAPFLLGMVVHH